jgi:hypothetical protein
MVQASEPVKVYGEVLKEHWGPTAAGGGRVISSKCRFGHKSRSHRWKLSSADMRVSQSKGEGHNKYQLVALLPRMVLTNVSLSSRDRIITSTGL